MAAAAIPLFRRGVSDEFDTAWKCVCLQNHHYTKISLIAAAFLRIDKNLSMSLEISLNFSGQRIFNNKTAAANLIYRSLLLCIDHLLFHEC